MFKLNWPKEENLDIKLFSLNMYLLLCDLGCYRDFIFQLLYFYLIVNLKINWSLFVITSTTTLQKNGVSGLINVYKKWCFLLLLFRFTNFQLYLILKIGILNSISF
jgi:hypothetical protein